MVRLCKGFSCISSNSDNLSGTKTDVYSLRFANLHLAAASSEPGTASFSLTHFVLVNYASPVPATNPFTIFRLDQLSCLDLSDHFPIALFLPPFLQLAPRLQRFHFLYNGADLAELLPSFHLYACLEDLGAFCGETDLKDVLGVLPERKKLEKLAIGSGIMRVKRMIPILQSIPDSPGFDNVWQLDADRLHRAGVLNISGGRDFVTKFERRGGSISFMVRTGH